MRPYLITLVALALASCAAPEPRRSLPAALAELKAGGQSLDAYNRAVEDVVLNLAETPLTQAGPRLAEHGVSFRLPPVKLPPSGLMLLPGGGEGLGAPVAVEYTTKQNPFLPPEGMMVSATAIYEANPPRLDIRAADGARLSLPGLPPDQPPRANYSEPYRILAKRARTLAISGFSGMTNPDGSARKPQFYLMEPYDPNKRVLLMVHGLQSTPVAFMPLVYALRDDPVVRRKYQVWHYHYATGTPVIVNSLILRDELARIIQAVDPDDNDFATRNMVVLGHSMGGVISHTLVSDSGNALWGSVFTVPPGQLQGERWIIDYLHRGMTFRANPRVKRAIFLASPHHGSPVSDSLAGKTGRLLTQLPGSLRGGLNDLARLNPRAMTPAGLEFYNGAGFSSIRTLSPRSPALLALARLPVKVPFHSIIGQRRPGPMEKSSDGVVPYTSAHLPGAESELVTPGNHNIFNSPIAQAEVVRILREEAVSHGDTERAHGALRGR